MKTFDISYTDRLLSINELISLYKLRNHIAKNENIKKNTKQILDDFYLIQKQSYKYIKFVIARYDGISRIFYFSEDYSKIFSDFIFEKLN
ncbi:hypothetical protein [Chryseobacterium sp. SL1]|uniref:hypothetical protein n=1 Tax=Chryseobacterium sp. SL1 TaxID=2995159 RepID=UPI002276A57D|nr:hypothetical protein [Chryseobacterium sp. SL1]MCY1661466.1 hypothetical protein [Chryseobacterium sp. SL1]